MRIAFHGGFGEKGRTCVGIEAAGHRLLLDAGVKTSARGAHDYYPAISDAALRALDAIILTHAHEDHVAALGWCIARGFAGRLFMTPETQRELGSLLADYASSEDAALVQRASTACLPHGDEALSLGPLQVTSGRSGHMPGGVWCRIDDGRSSVAYCGDVAPGSPVFAMDPIPRCDALVIDASYGDDDVGFGERAAQVAAWIDAHPTGSVLPTPLFGRSAELLAIVPGPIFLAPGMRDALRAQLDASEWLVDGVATKLLRRLDAARSWHAAERLPGGVLLCHDAMGLGGTSPAILAQARAHDHPVLFTGHVPSGSPGERLIGEARAQWIRLPTHPTLNENVALASRSAATTLLGHSCDRPTLARLAHHLPRLRADVATGDCIDI